MPTLTLLPERRDIEAQAGESVLKACRRAGVRLPSSCGGKGTCSKCAVRVVEGEAPVDVANVRGLAAHEVDDGYRLACRLYVHGDLSVEVPDTAGPGDERILTTSTADAAANGTRPNVRAVSVALPAPSMDDQECDFARLARGLGAEPRALLADLPQLRELSTVLREGEFKVTATLCGKRLMRTEVQEGGPLVGMAFDIGTTTVVGYLMDLVTGAERAVASRMNPQCAVGDDVLSRSDHAAKGESQLRELQHLIIKCLQEIAVECSERAAIPLDRCYEATLAGNTIMLHLALGLDPRYIARVPFTPVWTAARDVAAAELGLHFHPVARVYLLPCVAGYVGADIAAGMAATDLAQCEKPTLFVDIGTNGEVVLSDRQRRIACASPAGPAFEGARISCGLRAMSGAIDRVRFDEARGDIDIHTLGNKPATGICGTGLIDAVAVLLQQGALEPNGLLLDPDDAAKQLPAALASRIREGEQGSTFLLVQREQTAEQRRDLVLTQRDFR